jgi:hypothetical protein
VTSVVAGGVVYCHSLSPPLVETSRGTVISLCDAGLVSEIVTTKCCYTRAVLSRVRNEMNIRAGSAEVGAVL